MKGRPTTPQYSSSEQDIYSSSSNISLPGSRRPTNTNYHQQDASQQNAQRNSRNPPASKKTDYNSSDSSSYYEEEESSRSGRSRYQPQTTNNNMSRNTLYDVYQQQNQGYDSNRNRNLQQSNENYEERRSQLRPDLDERRRTTYNDQGRSRTDSKYSYDETKPLTQNPNEILKRVSIAPTPDGIKTLFVQVPNTRPIVNQSLDSNQTRRGTNSIVLDPRLEMEEKTPLDKYVRQNLSKFRKSADSIDSVEDLREGYHNLIEDYDEYTPNSSRPRGEVLQVYAETEDDQPSPWKNYDSPQNYGDKRVRSYNASSTSVMKPEDASYMRRIFPIPFEKRYTLCIKPTYKDPEREGVFKTKLGKNDLKISVRGNIEFNVNE